MEAVEAEALKLEAVQKLLLPHPLSLLENNSDLTDVLCLETEVFSFQSGFNKLSILINISNVILYYRTLIHHIM